jgi:histidine ammonia-lyase
MTSGLKLEQTVGLARMVVAIELLAAARAMDLRGDTSTEALERARAKFRERVPAWKEDCVLSVWMEAAAKFLEEDGWRELGLGRVVVEEVVR